MARRRSAKTELAGLKESSRYAGSCCHPQVAAVHLNCEVLRHARQSSYSVHRVNVGSPNFCPISHRRGDAPSPGKSKYPTLHGRLQGTRVDTRDVRRSKADYLAWRREILSTRGL